RADAAGTVLSALGSEAFSAVAKAFDGLDEGGRRVALDVLDHAPCAESSAVYIKALVSRVEAHRLHAIDRLRRCGPPAIPAIETAIASMGPTKLRPLAEILADVAPEKALQLLVPRLVGPAKQRRVLRDVISQAARSPKSKPVILELLARTDLPPQASVDLLRALGKQLSEYSQPAAASIQRLLVAGADFRTKYLLLAPAHLVCDQNPALAQQLALIMRTDPSGPLRTEAVRAAVQIDRFANELIAALEDSDVRVRQAAAQTLSGYKKAPAIPALRKRLKDDTWPLVRVAAAESLAVQPRDSATDQALVDALEDESWLVKSAAADAVGARRTTTAGEPLLDLLSDKKERFEVRVAAARALGDICYDRALDKLTDAAQMLRSSVPDPPERAVAVSALDALAKLHPRDLAARLKPLLGGKDTPLGTKQAAQAALAAPPRCTAPAPMATASNGAK
ncbi:MAG TPA: HEAT repeat domain-containing protein, partial [Polyangiaceae bacterium]|nr:HEAT repeat domain-containing protein [Polyangiaceae bacterium]